MVATEISVNAINAAAVPTDALARVDQPGISTMLRILATLSAAAAALSLIFASAVSLIVWVSLG